MSKYYNNKLFLFFLIFPLFNPMALKYIPALSGVYNVIQVWKLCSILMIMISYVLRKKVSRIIGLIISFEIISIITSFANGVFVSGVITDALFIIGISMLVEISVNVNFIAFYKMYFANAFWFSVLNCLVCLIYPGGLPMATLYTNWKNPLYLLTIDNGMIKELIPVLLMAYLGKLYLDNDALAKGTQKINIYFYVTQIVGLITMIMVGSAAGLMIYILIEIGMICANFKIKWKIPYKILLFVLIVFMVVVVIAGTDLQIVSTITGWFGRESNFTGRTLLWSLALEMVREHPWIGYGYTSGNIQAWGGLYSSHNLFIELVIQGGIIYLALFVITLVHALKRNSSASVHYSNTISVAVFAYLLVGLVETVINPHMFIFIVLACYPDLCTDAQVLKFKY